MRACIQYKGVNYTSRNKEHEGRVVMDKDKHNYTRYGKRIPHVETEIDICKYFGCNAERGAFIASQLETDSKIMCKLGEETKKAVAEIRKIKKSKLNINNPVINIKSRGEILGDNIEQIKAELRAELKEELRDNIVKKDEEKKQEIIIEAEKKIEEIKTPKPEIKKEKVK